MRLIDADTLMEDLSKWLKEVDPTHPPVLPLEEDIIVSTLMTIEEQPTIEAIPVKKGKWIKIDDPDDTINGKCSVCGWEAHLYEDDVVGMPYCPNCGTPLEGVEE